MSSTGPTTFGPASTSTSLIASIKPWLCFTFHHPQPMDRPINGGTFKFMVVDTKGSNHAGSRTAFRPDTESDIDVQLKPGQKMDA